MLGYELGQVVILRGDARQLPLSSADAVITSPPYEGSLQGAEPSGKLFTTERLVNSPASGNRKSTRKPMGQGYSKLQARADRVAKAHPGKRNVFQEALDNPGAISRRGYEYGYSVDAVISSPPYATRLADTSVDDDPQRMSYEMGKAKIDAVVSSPPFGEAEKRDQSPYQGGYVADMMSRSSSSNST